MDYKLVSTPESKGLYDKSYTQILELILMLCTIQPINPKDLDFLNRYINFGKKLVSET